MFNLNKNLVLHGIGKGYIQTVSDKITEIDYGQTLKIDVKATLVDVDGGDSLFPIYTFTSKKEGTIEIDSATFSLSQSGISQGVKYNTIGVKRNLRVLRTKSDLSLGDNLTGVSNVKCLTPMGELLEVTQTGAAAPVGGVLVGDDGEITWDAAVPAGEYVFWCKVDAQDAAEAIMLKDAMPEISSFTWTFYPGDKDGKKYQIDIFARRVRADGSFTIDTARDKASVPKLTLKVLDPGNGSDDFVTITVTKLK